MQQVVTRYRTITLHPHVGQFAIDELPLLVLCPGLLVYGGMDGMPLSGVACCGAMLLGLVLTYRYIYLYRTRYHITPQQFVYEYGIFSRKKEYVELYRVIDFDEHQSLMQQLLGLKTISIHSGDRTTPVIAMKGIKANNDVVSEIRARVYHNKKMNGIYEITNR